MLINKNAYDIINDQKLNKLFLSAKLNNLNIDCKIYKGNFFADSFNYFPITENFEVFEDLYKIQNDNTLSHFYTDNFINNFKKKSLEFKNLDNVFVLGSSPGNNYYANLINFLPRFFFNDFKKVKLVIHRNFSNKFRNLISQICVNLEKELIFNYLDDEFYKFNNSYIPQFLSIQKSIEILKFFLLKKNDYKEKKSKIYITRQNSNYRKVINESDVIELLKNNDYHIINLHNYEIEEQINLFSNADIVVSAIGSNLANIIFCKKGTKIYEIAPDLNNPYEINLSKRYKYLCDLSGLDHYKIKGDTIDIKSHTDIVKKYIPKKILSESCYYKDIIIKINELKNILFNS